VFFLHRSIHVMNLLCTTKLKIMPSKISDLRQIELRGSPGFFFFFLMNDLCSSCTLSSLLARLLGLFIIVVAV
jgi:hypothetical protein